MQGAHGAHARRTLAPAETEKRRCEECATAKGVTQTGQGKRWVVGACEEEGEGEEQEQEEEEGEGGREGQGMHARTCNRVTSMIVGCQSRPLPTASDPPGEYRHGSTCARHMALKLVLRRSDGMVEHGAHVLGVVKRDDAN